MNHLIRLLIADDHPVVRDGIRSMLHDQRHIHIIGEASGGRELVQACQQYQPDVVLTDVMMQEMDGEQATRILANDLPDVRVVAMSMFERYHDIQRMFTAGVFGYISKNAEKHEYILAVESAYEYRKYCCSRISKRLDTVKPNLHRLHTEVNFTEREIEVLKLLFKGYSNPEIAEKLQLSTRTVEGHRLKMLSKMDTSNIHKVVVDAVKAGILKLEDVE